MNARRLTLTVLGALCALLGALLLSSAPALAAAPETPTLTVEAPVHATTATFLGVLNPGTLLEPPQSGTYKFLYRASLTECTGAGGSETSSGLSFGGAGEALAPVTVTGLIPNTNYAVCLSVTNLESPSETTLSAPVQFATHTAPEKPETKAATGETATTAVLHGVLNPAVEAETGWYFVYSTGAKCTSGGPGSGETAHETPAKVKALAVEKEIAGLEPDRTYGVCLVATDEVGDATVGNGDATVGNEVIVKTLAPAPAVVTGAAIYSTATPFEATLHAEVNANDQATTVYFQYSTSPAVIGESLATPTDVPAAPGSSIGAGPGPVPVEDGTGPVLASGTLYYFQAVAINPTGTTYGAVEHFETLGVPTVQTGVAEQVTAASAEIGGKLDAGGEAEYYVEYGTEPCSVNTNSCGTKSEPRHASGKVQTCGYGTGLHECVYPILVSGLEPNTTYHYWLVAKNGAVSKSVHGEAKEFTTKLGAPLTGVAEDVTTTSAQITGELNPGGRGEAEYWVEYLLPSGSTERSAAAFANGKTQASVGPIVLTGLQPKTTYHYWLVAKSSAASEPVRGEARAFTTPTSQAELEAQAALNRRPAEELAAVNAAKQKLEAEEAKRAQEAAAVNAAKQRQYDEIAAETAGLLRLEAEAGTLKGTSKQKAKAKKAKPKPASCRKGFVKKHNKCVRTKSKKKGKVKK
jgi:hypothetical protein